MNFFDEVGKMALGTRVRFLGDRIGADAAGIYLAYGTALQPKWFPVFYVLTKGPETTITAIAERIGHSHASVSKIVAEMARAGLLREKADGRDRRRTNLVLSAKGRQIARKIEDQYTDVTAAVEELLREARHDLWRALEEWEGLLARKSLIERVLEKRAAREGGSLRIEPYRPQFREAFRRLNEQWITTYFKLEAPDRAALGKPQEYILDRGGHILVATLRGKAVGVCALLPREETGSFELAKMAVAPAVRGKGVGLRLGKAAIAKAASLGARSVFLESNTILEPAIRLYKKLGFRKIVGPPTPYERCNIQMSLKIPRAR